MTETRTDTATDTATDAGTSPLGGVGPIADKAKQFAKDRPYTAAALAGVVGLALLNTLRGKGRTS